MMGHSTTGAGIAWDAGGRFTLALLLPLGALVAFFVSFTNRQAAGKIGAFLGVGFLSWAFVEMSIVVYKLVVTSIKIFTEVAGIGLFATVIGVVLLTIGGLATMQR